MKIFIHLPTWLGDAVMASLALYAIKEHFKNAQFILYGSLVSTALFKEFPNSKSSLELALNPLSEPTETPDHPFAGLLLEKKNKTNHDTSTPSKFINNTIIIQ